MALRERVYQHWEGTDVESSQINREWGTLEIEDRGCRNSSEGKPRLEGLILSRLDVIL